MRPIVAVALRSLRRRTEQDLFYKPFVALVAAAVFAISCMPVPVPTAGTCSHPTGTGLAAVLIGPWRTVLVTVVALLIQALVLAHGGLTTLGAGVASMGVAGAFSGYLIFPAARRCGATLWTAGFLAGVVSDWATLFEALQGDLLRFAFRWAGLLSGFVIGYAARALFVEGVGRPPDEGRRHAE